MLSLPEHQTTPVVLNGVPVCTSKFSFSAHTVAREFLDGNNHYFLIRLRSLVNLRDLQEQIAALRVDVWLYRLS